VALSLGSPTSSVPCRLELTGEEHVALFRLVRHAVGLWSRDDCPPTGTSASSPGSGITQRRYGGDRNRATLGEDEIGAGPLLDFQRLYLASGGINLDRSRAAPPRTRKPGRGFIPQDLPLLLIGCSRLALTQLRLSGTHVPSRWASSSTPEEHSHAVLALPGSRHVRYCDLDIYSVRVLLPLSPSGPLGLWGRGALDRPVATPFSASDGQPSHPNPEGRCEWERGSSTC